MEKTVMNLKGSMTVFAALSMLLVASFLFALLEAARVQGLDACADMVSEVGVTSICAEYQQPIWEDYRLLFLDGAYGTEKFSEEKMDSVLCQRISENLDVSKIGGISMYGLSLQSAEVSEYRLASDGDGAVFLKCVASYMKSHLTKELAEELYQKYKEETDVENSDRSEYSVEGADKAIEEAKKAQEETASDTEEAQSPEAGETFDETSSAEPEETEKPEEPKENPLDIVLKLKENAILGMVVGNVSALSAKQVDLQNCMLKRELQKGTKTASAEVGWYERVLVAEYLEHYFSNYRNPKLDGAFSYELEYLLCGEDTDKSNLEGVINRLLLMREAANITAIIKDATKRNEAKAIAEILAGFTGNPAIILVVQCGIIAAWAYVESVLDLRALVRGDKIALVKSDAQWTCNTKSLADSLGNDAKAKNCENGLTYEEYLKMFLFTMGTKKLAYRMMDVIEQSVKTKQGYEHVRMDYMVCEMSCSIQYQADTLFADLSLIRKGASKGFCFEKMKFFSYIE